MTQDARPPAHQRWAHLRFSIVGPLLAAPPGRGELKAELARLAEKFWLHPTTGQPTRFGASTIERWFYRARRAGADPVCALRKRVRGDAGRRRAFSELLKAALLAQYRDHRRWSYQLHFDNLAVRARDTAGLGRMPSYATLVRFMKSNGWFRLRRPRAHTEGARRAQARLDEREVRSYEVEHVHGLWHADFHHASRTVLLADGTWVTPRLLGFLDDRSRVACHVQWYLTETAETFVHGLCQAFQKRGLPRAVLTDNGSPMIAAETQEGLARLGVLSETTLSHSPYQNGKQEVFWAQVEGRLMAMLENVPDLTLPLLNEATLAWVELEYNHKLHSELGMTPLDRLLAGPGVDRPCPASDELRFAFTTLQQRTQRRSDGTISLEGRRYEIPSRYRTLERVCVRYAAWDLATAWLVDPQMGSALCRIYPQDKARNANGRRRTLAPLAHEAPVLDTPKVEAGMAPLLTSLMATYAATGLPPAYVPQEPRAEEQS